MYDHYQALIFDMDGTVVDSGKLHEEAWTYALKQYDVPVDAAIMRRLAGVPTLRTVEILLQEFNLQCGERASGIASAKEEFVRKNNADFVRPTALLDVVREYAGKKPMAIGTGASTEEAGTLLAACDIKHFFDVIIGADQVDNHKPAPDTFLLAANKLGVKPEHCLVFEDSELGMVAAKAAKMAAVNVQTELNIRNVYFDS